MHASDTTAVTHSHTQTYGWRCGATHVGHTALSTEIACAGTFQPNNMLYVGVRVWLYCECVLHVPVCINIPNLFTPRGEAAKLVSSLMVGVPWLWPISRGQQSCMHMSVLHAHVRRAHVSHACARQDVDVCSTPEGSSGGYHAFGLQQRETCGGSGLSTARSRLLLQRPCGLALIG